MRWIVVANTVVARIYAKDSKKTTAKLTLITELNHPEGLKREQDLTSDRPGHYQTSGAARGSYGESHAKETENDKFAQQIARFLEQARTSNQLQSLMLIVAPHFLGSIEKHFTKSLQNLIDKIIQKNLVAIPQKELEEIITREQ